MYVFIINLYNSIKIVGRRKLSSTKIHTDFSIFEACRYESEDRETEKISPRAVDSNT
jgi:hypothetical protein